MNKWIRGFMVFALSVSLVQVGVAFALNTTTSYSTNASQAPQILSMSTELQKVAQNGEVVVTVKLMGQGNILNVTVDYKSVPQDYQTHFHTHYFLTLANIVVGKEETYRLRRGEASFPNYGINKKQAYITATGVRTMQGSNWPLTQTVYWTPNQSRLTGGLKTPRSVPNPLAY